jgi:hypothetical protein
MTLTNGYLSKIIKVGRGTVLYIPIAIRGDSAPHHHPLSASNYYNS